MSEISVDSSDSESSNSRLDGGRDRSQTADRTIEVLLLLARTGPLRLAELVDTLGVPRRNIGRLMASLEAAGLVRRNRQTLVYDLGVTLAWLGRLAEERVGLARLGEPIVESLRDATESTALLHVRQADGLVAAVVKVPRERFSVNFPVDVRIPAWVGIGRLVLAHLSPHDRRRQLAKIPHPVDLAALEEFRTQGYAISRGEVVEGVHALGAPVFDPAGELVAVLAVASLSDVEAHAGKVVAAAADLTQILRS